MIFGYIRVSTKEQSLDSQKNSISRYCVDRKLIVDEWFELEISSRQTTENSRSKLNKTYKFSFHTSLGVL